MTAHPDLDALLRAGLADAPPLRPDALREVFTRLPATPQVRRRPMASPFPSRRMIPALGALALGIVVLVVWGNLATSSPGPAGQSSPPASTTPAAPSPVRPEARWPGVVTEAIAPGLRRVVDDGTGHSFERVGRIDTGADGSLWVWTREQLFRLGEPGGWPTEFEGRRFGLLDVGADGTPWVGFGFEDGPLPGIGTIDATGVTMRGGPRRTSAFVRDPSRAPAVLEKLIVHPDGSAWAAEGEQTSPRWGQFTIERLQGDAWTTWAIDDGLPTLPCGEGCGDRSDVVVTPDDHVWVNVDQGGLLRYDGVTWQVVRPLGGDSDVPVTSIAGSAHGVVWALLEPTSGEDRQLARFDGATWTEYPAPRWSEPPSLVAVGPDGAVWLRSYDATTRQFRLASFDGVRWRSISDSDLPPCERQRCRQIVGQISFDADGNAWLRSHRLIDGVGDEGGGLYLLGPDALKDGVGEGPAPTQP